MRVRKKGGVVLEFHGGLRIHHWCIKVDGVRYWHVTRYGAERAFDLAVSDRRKR